MGAVRPALNLLLEPFRTRVGRETVRAFVVFAVLLAAIVAVAGQLAYRDIARLAKVQRILVGREEARKIAEFVGGIGAESAGIDYVRIRRNLPRVEREILRRIEESPLIERVELRDRFGAPVLSIDRSRGPGSSGLPRGPVHDIVVHLQRGAETEGQVRVAVSEEALDRDFDRLWRSFRINIALASAVAIGILVVGLFYVLHLLRKNRALEQSKLSAERAAYRGILASGLAHEIRNPLNAMNMNLQMLEEELQAVPGLGLEEWTDLLNSTKSEIKRLERLVNDFLQYARPPVPRFEPRDLGAIVRETATFLQADFRGHGVEIEVEPETLLPSVDVDESLLKQALMNVLVNARQVMKDGGKVHLRTYPGPGGEVVVEVRDEGPGIPPDVRERIFEPFYSNRGGGTGLGLPIARQIVETHGGRIEVESVLGKGATFRVRLPRRHGREAAGPSSPGKTR